MKSYRKLLIILSLVIIGVLFLKYGRTIYMPLIKKVSGKETVQSVIEKIEKGAWARLEPSMSEGGFKEDYPKEIILVAFKEEQVLEVYANDYAGIKLIKKYPFTSFSGALGPKLSEGDKQIPEGIYYVEYLNPNSSYYLSIKVNYPNEFDKSKTKFSDLKKMGGDIFIHGKAASIGCIPIGDEAIEEVFLMVQKSIKNRVKVIISPRDFRMNSEFPKIEKIDWEVELYEGIAKELNTLEINK